MKHILPIFIILILSVSCSQKTISTKADPVVEENSNFDAANLEEYLSAIHTNNKWLGSVAIAKDGKVIYAKSYGKLDPRHEKVTNTSTKYKIGSITKTYVATMIMQMVEEEKLGLDTNLSDYFPSIKNANTITIEHLLSHRSGIHSYTDHASFKPEEKVSDVEMLEKLVGFHSEFEPGSSFKYCNSGYFLLGKIIETIDKSSFEKILERRILNKINAPSIELFDAVERNKNEVISAEFKNKDWIPIPEWDYSQANAAGGLQANATDQIKFIEALFGGKFISNKSLELMMKQKDGYGLGLIQVPFNEKKGYGHNGGLEAFRSALYHFPEDGVTLSILSNGQGVDINNVLISLGLAAYGMPIEIPSFEVVEFEDGEMDKFVGKYESEDLPMDINIFIDGDTLFAQATGQSAFPVEKADGVTLTFDGAGIKMVFALLEEGKYGAFTLNQGGQQFDFMREE